MRSNRRRFLHQAAVLSAAAGPGLGGCRLVSPRRTDFHLATFSADVTVPLGHPLMGGGIAPAREIIDPLFARGLVFFGSGLPIVLAVVDWCEIRNDAYFRWRDVLADAAGTIPSRVLVSSVHVHDAPVADLTAERILRESGATGSVCDPAFHEIAVQRVARSVRAALGRRQRVTQVGFGSAAVDQVASNRRFVGPDGSLTFGRTSASRDAAAHSADVGLIDPLLRTLSFWQGDRPLAALHVYATHPMSYYGQGGVSADFVGLARARRQADAPDVFQIYASGCSGNVTAGKHNDGNPANRPVLARRIYDAMVGAGHRTERHPLNGIHAQTVSFELQPRGGDFGENELRRRLAADKKPFGQCLAALGLSWRERVRAGHLLDLPVIDFGAARLLLLPAESYVEYQLYAQQIADRPVVTLGYGECAPGYIPTETAWSEADSNLGDWCWVAPGAEAVLKSAIRKAGSSTLNG